MILRTCIRQLPRLCSGQSIETALGRQQPVCTIVAGANFRAPPQGTLRRRNIQHALPSRHTRGLSTTSTRPREIPPAQSPPGSATPGSEPTPPSTTPPSPSFSPQPPPETPPTQQQQQQQQQNQQGQARRGPRSRRILLSATFLLLGTILGSSARLLLQPPPPPVPGSAEDAALLASLDSQASRLAVVETLTASPDWAGWTAYAGLAPASRPSRLTTGPLAGARGLALQRVFRNAATGEIVSVVWFGPATAGWPGVVHGGCLATVLDESLARAAVCGPSGPLAAAGTAVTAALELSFRAPTLVGEFLLVRAKAEPAAVAGGGGDGAVRKAWVDGVVERLDGSVCATARGLFVVPKDGMVGRMPEEF